MEGMPEHEWMRRTGAALAWLRRSVEVTGGKGSSHSYSPVFGWAKAYPETTGYLIETLFDYARLNQDHSLRDLAFQCANWLISIQLPDGSFPGLLAGNTLPSVFNTSQILFGLARAAEENRGGLPGRPLPSPALKDGYASETEHQAMINALTRATGWLLSMLEPDFAWRKHAYVEGFTPSYYARAVLGVLKANQILQNADTEWVMRRALRFYADRILSNGAVRDWGFWPGKPAFTHTIAYTLEGFSECAVLLDEKEILEKEILAGEIFLKTRNDSGRTAGRYNEQWRGDYSFLCVSGNCQLSVFFYRLWQLTGDEKFRKASRSILMEIIGFQRLGHNRNTFGALPGSAPLWGPYLRFRYPNWGVKFFLDAMGNFFLPAKNS